MIDKTPPDPATIYGTSGYEYDRTMHIRLAHRGTTLVDPNPIPKWEFYLGLDLGWTNDYTALSVSQLKTEALGPQYRELRGVSSMRGGGLEQVWYEKQDLRPIHHIRHLDRIRGVSPDQVASDVVERLIALGVPGKPVLLGVDASNDWSFVSLLRRKMDGVRDRLPAVKIEEIAIRSNREQPRRDEETGRLYVPRNDLLIQGGANPLRGEAQRYVNGQLIKIPKRKQARIRWRLNLPYRRELEQELLSFEPQVNLNTDYVRWEPRRRDGHEHDDLTFALCFAVLLAESYAPEWIDPTRDDNERPVPWEGDAPVQRSPLLGTPIPPIPPALEGGDIEARGAASSNWPH